MRRKGRTGMLSQLSVDGGSGRAVAKHRLRRWSSWAAPAIERIAASRVRTKMRSSTIVRSGSRAEGGRVCEVRVKLATAGAGRTTVKAPCELNLHRPGRHRQTSYMSTRCNKLSCWPRTDCRASVFRLSVGRRVGGGDLTHLLLPPPCTGLQNATRFRDLAEHTPSTPREHAR